MVLSNRFATKAPRTLLQRTLIYVVGFGTGALVIALAMSFAVVSLAEGFLPGDKAPKASGEVAAGQPLRIIGAPSKTDTKRRTSLKPPSLKRPSRGNEARGAKKGEANGRL